MKKCVVIGGGIAGLSAAAYLTKHNIKVSILESSPKAGGRAYSFKDSASGDIIDNGQHILMGCYKETINFIKIIGAKDNFIFNRSLKINFLKPGGEKIKLNAIPYFYPVNLLFALLKFNALSTAERISLIRFMLKIPFTSHQGLSGRNVSEWLKDGKQNENIIKSLWEIIAVGALNTNISKASALMFREILMKIFFKGNFASTIILPKYGLSESYVEPAVKFIEAGGGELKLSYAVDDVDFEADKITGIKVKDKFITDFDFVISTVPFDATTKIFPGLMGNKFPGFEYSTIVNIHTWVKENPFNEPFFGLIGSRVHWIFNKGSHINLVISDADYLAEKPGEDIFNMCVTELEKFTGIREDDIVRYKIIKEKKATFVPDAGLDYTRPSGKTQYHNLYFAGDWVDTGLPSTIESAVKSGRTAAKHVINNYLSV